METNEVSFVKKGNVLHRVVVGEETAIMRLRRANLKLEAVNTVGEDADTRILHIIFYTDCVAATVDWCDGHRPTFEEFAQLPGKFVDDWAAAVWVLNPDWMPTPEGEEPAVPTPAEVEEIAKKVSSLPNDLSN